MPLTPEQFQRNMAAAARKIADPREAMQRIVLIAEAASKKRAPVRTGTLRRSITSRVENARRGLVGSSLSYAPYVHEGTKHMKGRPFIREGIQDARPAIVDELVRYGIRVLDEVGR